MKKRLLGLFLTIMALVAVLTVGVNAAVIDVPDGLVVETANSTFRFMMSTLFTSDAYETYKVSLDDGDTWTEFNNYINLDGYWYEYSFEENDYGTKDIWFECSEDDDAFTLGEQVVQLKLTLAYYPNPTEPNSDEFYEIYSYQQLKSVVEDTMNSQYKIKLMNDIGISFTTLTSGSTTATTNNTAQYYSPVLNLSDIIEIDGNNYTINYDGYDLNDETDIQDTTDTYLFGIGANYYDCKIYNLTIDCNENVNGLRISCASATLTNVNIIDVIDDGFCLNAAFYADVEVDSCTIATSSIGYGSGITNISRTTAFETIIDGVVTTLPMYNTYMADSASYATLDAVIAGANAYQGVYFVVSQMESDTLTDTTIELTNYLELYFYNYEGTFTNTDDNYSFIVDDGGWLDISFQTVSANNGNLVLVKDGGAFDTWGRSNISGVTVENGGEIHANGYTSLGYYYAPTLNDIILQIGATFQNDSDATYSETSYGTDYTIYVQNSDGSLVAVTVDAGVTYVAVETTAVAEVNGISYADLGDALAAASSGDTISILTDITLDTEVTIPDGITLFLPEDVTISGTITGTTITFDANGGTSAVATAMIGGTTLSSVPTATLSGYTFKGWYLNGEKITTDTVFDEDVTVTASWSKNSTSTNTGTLVSSTTTTTTDDDDVAEESDDTDDDEEITTTDDEETTGSTLSSQESANLEATGYTDVATDAWYADAVEYAVTSNLFQGTSSTGFSPDTPMSREMTWVVLARLNGLEISGATAYADALEWAVENGISDGTYPSDSVTREQLVTLLWRNAGSPEAEGDLSAYDDAGDISDYAQTAMAWAIENGVISGMDATTLNPIGEATRAQVAQIMMNLG